MANSLAFRYFVVCLLITIIKAKLEQHESRHIEQTASQTNIQTEADFVISIYISGSCCWFFLKGLVGWFGLIIHLFQYIYNPLLSLSTLPIILSQPTGVWCCCKQKNWPVWSQTQTPAGMLLLSNFSFDEFSENPSYFPFLVLFFSVFVRFGFFTTPRLVNVK